MSGTMRAANWARVYHAYFQEMVVKGITEAINRSVGPDAGFSIVASIVERGAMRGFKILMEELAKEGVKVERLSLRDLLEYEVKCHRYAIEKMNVEFQLFERVVEEDGGKRYILETEKCIYRELAEKNPVVCAVCVGLTTGILRQAGIRARWISKPERKQQLCSLPEGERPEYVVYRDPRRKLPSCGIVIEKLECPQEATQQNP